MVPEKKVNGAGFLMEGAWCERVKKMNARAGAVEWVEKMG